MVLARLQKAGQALITKAQGWSPNFLAKVFHKEKTAKLTDKDIKKIESVAEAKPKENFFDLKEWNKVERVDLTSASRLPQNYRNPNAVKVIRVNASEISKEYGIINDPMLRNNLPANGVKVQAVATKKQIFDILSQNPRALSVDMAHILIGSKEGVTGLSPASLSKALQRMEEKYQGDERYLPKTEVRELLIGHLLNKGSDKLHNHIRNFRSVLKNTKYEEMLHESAKERKTYESPEAKKAAKENITKGVVADEKDRLTKTINQRGIKTVRGDVTELVDNIYDSAKAAILENAKKGKRFKLSTEDKLNIVKRNFAQTRQMVAIDSEKDFDKLALEFIHRLETMYENGGNALSKNYSRLTRLNSDTEQDKAVLLKSGKITQETKLKQAKGFKGSVIEGLTSIPKPFLAELYRSGYQIEIANNMEELGISGPIKNDHFGRYHENTPGTYFASSNRAVVTREYMDRSTGRMHKSSNSKTEGIVRHETAHAIENLLNKHPEHAKKIRKAYLADFDALRKEPENIQRSMSYQMQTDKATPDIPKKAGIKEAFANAFAVVYGGDRYVMPFRFNNLEKAIKDIEGELAKNPQVITTDDMIARRLIVDSRVRPQQKAA